MVRLVAIALVFGLTLGLGVPHAAQARALVLGSISVDPSDEIKDWLPFARYLAGELATDGITEGKVVIARDTSEMVAFLKAGKVDLYIDSPLVMLDVAGDSGSKLLARRWKKGSPEYTSVIFTRQGADIKTIDDLKDKVVAFEKESSSTGYLLPLLEIRRAGLPIHAMGDAAAPKAGEIGYRMSGADRNTLAWVLFGRVAAGATSREHFERLSPEQRAQLVVVAETAPIPRHVVAHRGDLSPALVARIKDVLLRADHTKTGQKALSKFERTTRFDEIPQQSRDALAQYERALHAAGLTQ